MKPIATKIPTTVITGFLGGGCNRLARSAIVVQSGGERVWYFVMRKHGKIHIIPSEGRSPLNIHIGT